MSTNKYQPRSRKLPREPESDKEEITDLEKPTRKAKEFLSQGN